MGYDVHITRKENWFDEDSNNISLEEWKSYISTDPEMRLDNYAEVKTESGSLIRIESEGLSGSHIQNLEKREILFGFLMAVEI